MPPPTIDHIAIQVYGPRHQLLGHCKVPAAAVPELAAVFEQVQRRNPAFGWVSLLRWVQRAGLKAVKYAMDRNGPMPVP